MDISKLIQKIEKNTLLHVKDESAMAQMKKDLKSLKRACNGIEFRLKRTLQDKQVTTNVLRSTISELEVKSKNLKLQKKLTEQQASFKEELFANVSHELRTPLHGILGMSHLLENTHLDNVQKDYVDITKSSANNLLVIINDILNLSQINAGKVELLHEPFSTTKFFSDLIGILDFKAKKKDLNLIFVKPPNFPAFLKGDRTRLYQILLNLLNNALKFTDKGHVSLNIFILNQTETSIDVQFDITDTGIGMKKEKFASIFDSFTQVHQDANHIYEGAGLGLNIVKKLLNLMGGSIDVDSTPNQGTTFSVKLSFDLPDSKQIDAHISTESDIVIQPHWQYKKMLMIEDNPANLVYAKGIFSDWGIKLDVAESISEVTPMVAKKRYDCILSDVKLPDGNGLDFIANLRETEGAINQNTPVIVLTASANEKEANYSKSIDVQSYIGKPFPPELLVSELKKILDNPIKKEEKKSIKAEKVPQKEKAYFYQLERVFKNKNKAKVEMIDIFLSQIPVALREMEVTLEQENIDDFHFQAHRIKSTINIVGLPKLSPIITKIDDYCYKKVNLEQIPELFEQFKKQAQIDTQIAMNERENLMTPLN
jgi:signal transduction histidine kinase/DNA-binding response OmpR family regulator